MAIRFLDSWYSRLKTEGGFLCLLLSCLSRLKFWQLFSYSADVDQPPLQSQRAATSLGTSCPSVLFSCEMNWHGRHAFFVTICFDVGILLPMHHGVRTTQLYYLAIIQCTWKGAKIFYANGEQQDWPSSGRNVYYFIQYFWSLCLSLSGFYNLWLSRTASLQYRKCLKHDKVQSRSQRHSLP